MRLLWRGAFRARAEVEADPRLAASVRGAGVTAKRARRMDGVVLCAVNHNDHILGPVEACRDIVRVPVLAARRRRLVLRLRRLPNDWACTRRPTA